MTKKFKKFPRKKNLPVRLSGWIEEAVEDVKMLEKHPDFEIDMSTFNSGPDINNPDVCHVCLGGAAIVGAGLVTPKQGRGVSDQLSYKVATALDAVRCGELVEALVALDLGTPYGEKLQILDELSLIIKVDFSYDRNFGMAKLSTYKKVAKELAKIGY